jgi:protein involved in polysaccharide export with SLBB domain
LAGGVVDGAIMSEISVQRQSQGNQLRKIIINLYQYIISGDERLLPPLHENDTVFVPISAAFGNVKRTLSSWSPPETRLEKDTAQKVRILGAVNVPGVYEPEDDMNLLELLVLANGETDSADMSNIQIIRDKETKKYNLNQMLIDSAELPKIQNGDTVRVSYMERTGYKKKSSEKKIRIIGAVVYPGGYEYEKDINLLDIIAIAGGERDIADLSDVRIIRGDKIERFNLSLYITGDGQVAKKLPIILGGDIIHVAFLQREEYRKAEAVFVLGRVKSPGDFELDPGMTVLQLLALANGLEEFADSENIMIIRIVKGKQKNIPYNFKMGVRGLYPELNYRLKPNDIIFVP